MISWLVWLCLSLQKYIEVLSIQNKYSDNIWFINNSKKERHEQ